ncbi:MAG: nitroreductase family protein [Promethearchaeota archaeon]
MKLWIDQDKCVKCGLCERDCPGHAIALVGEMYQIRSEYCIECSHCACICPKGAVESDAGSFPEWSAPDFQPDGVFDLVAGTRSVRQYKPDPIPGEVVERILHLGSLTATASNKQDWRVVALTGEAVATLRDACMGFFAKLSKLARKGWVQSLIKLVPAGRRLLEDPHAIDKLLAFVGGWEAGNDVLFFGAPLVLVLHSSAKNPFGRTNNVLASAAIRYYAQSMGIGSCYVGFAEQFLNRKSKVKQALGVPSKDIVDVVLTLGYSNVTYHRLPVRSGMPVRYVDSIPKLKKV